MKLSKILSLVLACLLILGLLAGCANEPAAPTETPSTTTPPAEAPADKPADAPAEEPADEPTDVPADEPVEEPAELPPAPTDSNINEETGYALGGLTLPLADDLTTITAFRSWSGTQSKYISSPGESAVAPILEERTNVHIEWNTYSAAEQFPLYIAAQDFDDMICAAFTTYTGGIDKAIEDEVYIPANDYMHLMPNYTRLLSEDAAADRESKTDSGNYFFRHIQTGNQPAWVGPMVRTDWLDDCGLAMPVTFDDWYEMLVTFRDQCSAESPLMFSTAGYSTTGFGIMPGFNTVGTFYAENGTTVKYGFLDEGMREYVEMMAKWYGEGLIDKDFVSHSVWTDSTSMYTADQVGAFDDLVYTMRSTLPMINPDEDDDICAVPFPTKTEAEQGNLHFRRYNAITGDACTFVTTAADDRGVAELCAKWIDYRYSEDGYFLLNWGPEGETWNLGEDGLPHFTDLYLKNETYTVSEIEYIYTDCRIAGVYAWIRENDQHTPEVLSAYDVWNASSKGDWVMPAISMTAEEAEDYSSIYNNIQTYVNEMVLRFITGTAPLSDWDAFVEEIYSMGIEECIGYQQAALDRFNAR